MRVSLALASWAGLMSEYLTTRETSEYLNVPLATLRAWRKDRVGPKSFAMGARKVMYRKTDIESWLEKCYAETADYDAG